MVEDENGNIVRETMKDNDVLMQYRTMRETLIYLSHLDYEDTELQMLEKLRGQMSGTWTWNGLNTLCWAIGSISGSMHVSRVLVLWGCRVAPAGLACKFVGSRPAPVFSLRAWWCIRCRIGRRL